MKKGIIIGLLILLLIAGCISTGELRKKAPIEKTSSLPDIEGVDIQADDSPQEEGRPASEASEEEPAVYGLNEKVVVGNLAYIVKEVITKEAIGSYILDTFMGAEADGIYLIFILEVENVGDEAEYISSSNIKIIDEQRREFESDFSATLYLDNDPELKALGIRGLSFDSLNPGLKREVAVVFDVPPDMKGILQIIDNIFFASEVAYIEWD
jgi:hypothetical protein